MSVCAFCLWQKVVRPNDYALQDDYQVDHIPRSLPHCRDYDVHPHKNACHKSDKVRSLVASERESKAYDHQALEKDLENGCRKTAFGFLVLFRCKVGLYPKENACQKEDCTCHNAHSPAGSKAANKHNGEKNDPKQYIRDKKLLCRIHILGFCDVVLCVCPILRRFLPPNRQRQAKEFRPHCPHSGIADLGCTVVQSLLCPWCSPWRE